MENWLLDTNIFLRGFYPLEPEHLLARQSVVLLRRKQLKLHVTLQNMTEFWNMCTRPVTARGGFGLSTEETDQRLRLIERHMIFLADTEMVKNHWRDLVTRYQVRGVQAHDAKLVAVMLAHDIKYLLTFNNKDFARYKEIKAIHPEDIENTSW